MGRGFSFEYTNIQFFIDSTPIFSLMGIGGDDIAVAQLFHNQASEISHRDWRGKYFGIYMGIAPVCKGMDRATADYSEYRLAFCTVNISQ